MNDNTKFEGSIPENYDKYLGPMLFEFSAKDLASRVSHKVGGNSKILEIACGTGIATQYLRETLPESISILATDLQAPMLEIAQQKRGGLKNVSYQLADALDLEFDDASFDCVVCAFGVMFFPDKAKGMSEMMRVLKPGGTIAFNVWDGLENNKAVKVSKEVIETFFEANPPKFLEMPFGYNDTNEITGLMQAAGVKDIEFEYVTASFDNFSAEHIARGFVTGTPTLAEINERGTADAQKIIAAVAQQIQETFGDSPKVTFQEIVFVGVKG